MTARDDGTTDDDTFLRGIQVTDDEGMIEFLTLFPGYYITRTSHIHVTVQTNITNGTGFSESKIQHIGQLFFEEDLLNEVYQLSPYSDHLETLNRTTNAEDSLYSSASSDGYSAVISVSQIGDALADGLVGYVSQTLQMLITRGYQANMSPDHHWCQHLRRRPYHYRRQRQRPGIPPHRVRR